MFCRKCGNLNNDGSHKCRSCGSILQEGSIPQPVQQIPNYLVQSILVSLFCCLPLGIPAIVFAAQVNSKVQLGDIEGAIESSRKAKQFVWWSFGVGIVVGTLYFAVMVLTVAAG